MATTAYTVITAAFELLNVFQPGESVPGPDAISALGWLNRMLNGWAQQTSTIPAIGRTVVPLVSGKGGVSNPYTIGIGGDINIAKPASPANISAVALQLGASMPPVEIPRGIMTDDGWQATQIKGLTNSLFTDLYYTATSPLGTINLWPIPLDATNSLVLYIAQALTQFVNLTAQYQIPDGYEDALVYNLAKRIAKPWGAAADPELAQQAYASLCLIKRSNLRLSDLPNDLVFQRPRQGYDITTGSGG
jgi:hypothetical protein